MGCCDPLRRNLTRWAVAVTAAALLLTGATVWGAQKLASVGDNVECIIDGFRELKGFVDSFNLTAAGDAADAIDEAIIDNIETGLTNWNMRVYGPGMVTVGLLLLAALTAMLYIKAGPPKLWRCSSKWLVFVANLFLLISLLFFAVCLFLGVASGLSFLTGTWEDNIEKACVDNRAELNDQLDEARADLAAVPPSAPQSEVDAANDKVDEAQEQLDIFFGVCDCIEETLGVLKPLLGPGILGIISFFVGLVAVNGLCCTMSCCREPAGNKLSDLPPAAESERTAKVAPSSTSA